VVIAKLLWPFEILFNCFLSLTLRHSDEELLERHIYLKGYIICVNVHCIVTIALHMIGYTAEWYDPLLQGIVLVRFV